MQHSRVLCNANSIPLVPELAEEYGIREALLLQQIHYWITHKERDPARYQQDMFGGFHWYYSSFEALAENHAFLGHANHIRRMVKKLCEAGVLIKTKPNASAGDHTHWYRINHEVLEAAYFDRMRKNSAERLLKEKAAENEAHEIARKAIEEAKEKGRHLREQNNNPVMASNTMLDGSNNMLGESNKMLNGINKMRDSLTKTTPETTAEITSEKEEARARKSILIDGKIFDYDPKDRHVKTGGSGRYRAWNLPKHNPQGFVEFLQAHPMKITDMAVFARQYWDKIKPSAADVDASIKDFPNRMKTAPWVDGFLEHPRKYVENRSWNDPAPENTDHQSNPGIEKNIGPRRPVETVDKRRGPVFSNKAKNTDRFLRRMAELGEIQGGDAEVWPATIETKEILMIEPKKQSEDE